MMVFSLLLTLLITFKVDLDAKLLKIRTNFFSGKIILVRKSKNCAFKSKWALSSCSFAIAIPSSKH